MKLFIYISRNPERFVTGDPAPGMGGIKIIERERVVFYEERHAALFGNQMKEFLGVTEENLLEKSSDEIRAMNLPKIYPQPRQTRSEMIKQLGVSKTKLL